MGVDRGRLITTQELGKNFVVRLSMELVDTTVGSDCVIEQTTARESRIGDGCTVGPYASLATGSEVQLAVQARETLQGEGPFTVFAPTDGAFDRA